MASVNVATGSTVGVLGNALSEVLTAQDIQPGDPPSYQTCKTLYLYHPLGLKMAEWPIRMAQSQQRQISVPNSPEEKVREQFRKQWEADLADKTILQTMTLSRVYGVASMAMLAENKAPKDVIDPADLAGMRLAFNVFDPLNTAGSLVLNQNPNAMDFMKVPGGVSVQGADYHRSRCVVIMNEQPIYLGYTTSAFGYVGRSVYQRALYPLKSFVQTMVTDDMISRKAGVLIFKLKPAGSIVDNIMAFGASVKRALLQLAQTDNVLSINAPDEEVESLNLQNIDGAGKFARTNILENIATAADMPSQIMKAETFAEGFGEGTEDAKYVAKYIDRTRREMQPLYDFFDRTTKRRAWTEGFYKTIQAQFPDSYGGKTYTQAFYEWSNSFAVEWPNLLTEPDSEKAKSEKVKHESIIATVEVLEPILDPENKATLVDWAAQNLNENKMMFTTPLVIDIEALRDYVPPAPPGFGEEGEGGGLTEPKPPKPFHDGGAIPSFLGKRKIAALPRRRA